jgi:putative flippase GtrA
LFGRRTGFDVRATYVAAREVEAKKGTGDPGAVLGLLAISSIAAIVNLLVGFSLYGLLGLSTGSLYALSVAIGYLAGMAVNWSLNRVFTFPGSGRRKLSELRTFVVVALIGLLPTVALAAGFRSTLAPYIAELVARNGRSPAPSVETTAQVMAVALVAVYSFLSHKWLTFDRGIRFQVSRWGRLAVGRSTDVSEGVQSPFPPPNTSIAAPKLPMGGALNGAQATGRGDP